jgi:uncharacterized protein (DUF2336 family)
MTLVAAENMLDNVVSGEDGSLDIGRLISLAQHNDQQSRAVLYQVIWDLFEEKAQILKPPERRLMSEILGRLSHDVEMTLRMRLADRLSQDPSAPRELILMLANDEISVAQPILRDNRSLRDLDLVDVIRRRSQRHQMAIAVRDNIGEAVSQALVDTGRHEVIGALLGNTSAQISDTLMAELVELSEHDRDIQLPLLRRRELTADLAARMYAWVSLALRQHILQSFDVDAATLDQALNASVRDSVNDHALTTPTDDPRYRLIEKLYAAGELSPAFVVKSLKRSEITLFELASAKLAGMEPGDFRRTLYDGDGRAFAAVCRTIGFDQAVFADIYGTVAQADGRERSTERGDVAAIVDFYKRLGPDTAARMIAQIRAN